MTQEILDEVAFLIMEQFDDFYGMLVDRTDDMRFLQRDRRNACEPQRIYWNKADPAFKKLFAIPRSPSQTFPAVPG